MRIILHVDFNSYFASVKQQKNPYLRGKPVGVIKGQGRSVIIAASTEAKKLGVKTGTNIYEAKKLIPKIFLVQADFDSYYDTTKRFVEIVRRYSDLVELFSLDEVFLDATKTAHLFDPSGGGPRQIALLLKRDIRQELGDWLTVSIGIAKNKLLAKFASDLVKPDGLVEITDQNQDKYLARAEFDQICGIGRGLTKRLSAMGVSQLLQIRSIEDKYLLASFGPHWARELKRIAWGQDDSPLLPTEDLPLPKSVSRTHTLYRETTNQPQILATIRNLVEEAAEKLRSAKMAGRQFGLMIRGSGVSGHVGKQSDVLFVTRKDYTNDSLTIFGELKRLYKQSNWYSPTVNQIMAGKPIRFLGVWISLLAEEKVLTDSLLPFTYRRRLVLQAQDDINHKFGHYTIFPASLLRTNILLPEVNGYLGDERIKQRINQTINQ